MFGLLVGSVSAVAAAGITGGTMGIVYAVNNKNDYNNRLKQFIADAKAEIIGKVAENTARKPEAFPLLKYEEEVLFKALDSDKITPWKAYGIGILGGGSIEALARSEEQYKIIESETDYYINSILDGNDANGVATGEMGSKAGLSIGRSPAYAENIRNCYKNIIEPIKDKINYNNAYGIGLAGGAAIEAIARQPSSENNINDCLSLAVTNLIKPEVSVYQGHAIGKVASSVADAIARQPSAASKIKEFEMIIIYQALHSPAEAGLGFYGLYQAVDGVARAPEESNTIMWGLMNIVFPALEKANINNAKAIGDLAGEACVAIARVPDAANLIWAEVKYAVDELLKIK